MPVPGPELLTRLLDEYGATLVLYARQWCHSPEDVVQEAFLQLMRESHGADNVVGWLFRVVRNGAISVGRSRTHGARATNRRRRRAQRAVVRGKPGRHDRRRGRHPGTGDTAGRTTRSDRLAAVGRKVIRTNRGTD